MGLQAGSDADVEAVFAHDSNDRCSVTHAGAEIEACDGVQCCSAAGAFSSRPAADGSRRLFVTRAVVNAPSLRAEAAVSFPAGVALQLTRLPQLVLREHMCEERDSFATRKPLSCM